MELEAINLALFKVLNASADLSGPLLVLAKVAARDLIDALIAILVLNWLFGNERDRHALPLVVFAALLSLALNYLVAQGFPHPRPFMIGVGHTFVSHRAESGFPSDHASPMWTIALGMLLWSHRKWIGWFAVALAAATSWARVFIGVHFPFDILGSMAVAAASVGALVALQPLIERVVASPIEAWYVRVGLGRIGGYPARLCGLFRDATRRSAKPDATPNSTGNQSSEP